MRLPSTYMKGMPTLGSSALMVTVTVSPGVGLRGITLSTVTVGVGVNWPMTTQRGLPVAFMTYLW